MNFSPAQKVMLFIAASFFSLVGAVYLYVNGVAAFWTTGSLAIITIIAPLFSSFFMYEGRLRKITFALSLLAMVLVLVLFTDAIAVHDSFAHLCNRINYVFTYADQGYDCTGTSEASNISVGMLSGSLLSITAFVLYFPLVLLGTANIFVMIVKWYKARRK
jgi:hypothetical protein